MNSMSTMLKSNNDKLCSSLKAINNDFKEMDYLINENYKKRKELRDWGKQSILTLGRASIMGVPELINKNSSSVMHINYS